MASRKYTIGRPLQDVRLKDWPAGKVAQLKRAIEILEGELNVTMASQVAQGAKRVLSTRVPKITGLSVRAGFKNFQVTFNEAKGISDLLFYELQKDSTSSFNNPTTFNLPQTTLTIPTSTEHEQVFFRVRCINSKFQVGPWSSTSSATGSGNFRMTATRQNRTTTVISPSSSDPWVEVGSLTYTPTAATTCFNLHVGAHLLDTDDATSSSPHVKTSNIATVYFRVKKDGVVYSEVGTTSVQPTSSYDNQATEGLTSEARVENAIFNSIVFPFETFLGDEDSITYTVEAQYSYTESIHQDLVAMTTVSPTEDINVYVDAFDIIELVQST